MENRYDNLLGGTQYYQAVIQLQSDLRIQQILFNYKMTNSINESSYSRRKLLEKSKI